MRSDDLTDAQEPLFLSSCPHAWRAAADYCLPGWLLRVLCYGNLTGSGNVAGEGARATGVPTALDCRMGWFKNLMESHSQPTEVMVRLSRAATRRHVHRTGYKVSHWQRESTSVPEEEELPGGKNLAIGSMLWSFFFSANSKCCSFEIIALILPLSMVTDDLSCCVISAPRSAQGLLKKKKKNQDTFCVCLLVNFTGMLIFFSNASFLYYHNWAWLTLTWTLHGVWGLLSWGRRDTLQQNL